MNEITLHLDDIPIARTVFGERDHHLALLEKGLNIEIRARGTDLTFLGTPSRCHLARRIVAELYALGKKNFPITTLEVTQAITMLQENPNQNLANIFLDSISVQPRRHAVTPKTPTQKTYIEAIRGQDLVFGWGPAGTGKTYLAMAMAVAAIMEKQVDRIILTRPAVEAGEKLGFLPGDIAEKVNPYLRPLFDALHDLVDLDRVRKWIERGAIELAPLAFMRGRTLQRSFIILDEAQNTTSEQMKMFLTRLGPSSKAVVTGDITQIDLPSGKISGLIEALDILKRIDTISFVQFSDRDVVRHPLVRKIIRAYEAKEKKRRTT